MSVHTWCIYTVQRSLSIMTHVETKKSGQFRGVATLERNLLFVATGRDQGNVATVRGIAVHAMLSMYLWNHRLWVKLLTLNEINFIVYQKYLFHCQSFLLLTFQILALTSCKATHRENCFWQLICLFNYFFNYTLYPMGNRNRLSKPCGCCQV